MWHDYNMHWAKALFHSFVLNVIATNIEKFLIEKKKLCKVRGKIQDQATFHRPYITVNNTSPYILNSGEIIMIASLGDQQFAQISSSYISYQ